MTPSTFSNNRSLDNFIPPDEGARVQLERRYKVIEPLLEPSLFPNIWARNRAKRVRVIDWLARRHRVSRRTIYNWLDRFDRDGSYGLVPKARCDRGVSRILNAAARGFLHDAVSREHRKTARSLYRAYCEEARRRGAAVLPAICYTTFRCWLKAAARTSHRPIVAFRTLENAS